MVNHHCFSNAYANDNLNDNAKSGKLQKVVQMVNCKKWSKKVVQKAGLCATKVVSRGTILWDHYHWDGGGRRDCSEDGAPTWTKVVAAGAPPAKGCAEEWSGKVVGGFRVI